VATPQPVQQQAPVYPPQPTQMPGYSQTAAYPMYPAQAGNIKLFQTCFILCLNMNGVHRIELIFHVFKEIRSLSKGKYLHQAFLFMTL
jgi:hypothetical protein